MKQTVRMGHPPKTSQIGALIWGVLGAAIAFPMVPLFDHLGKPEFGRPAAFIILLGFITLKVCWNLRGRLWFWLTLLLFAALHVPLIMLVAGHLSRISLFAFPTFCVVELFVMLVIVEQIEKVIEGRKSTH